MHLTTLKHLHHQPPTGAKHLGCQIDCPLRQGSRGGLIGRTNPNGLGSHVGEESVETPGPLSRMLLDLLQIQVKHIALNHLGPRGKGNVHPLEIHPQHPSPRPHPLRSQLSPGAGGATQIQHPLSGEQDAVATGDLPQLEHRSGRVTLFLGSLGEPVADVGIFRHSTSSHDSQQGT